MAATRRDHGQHMNEVLRRDLGDMQLLIYDNPVKCILTAKFNSCPLSPQLSKIVEKFHKDLFIHQRPRRH